MRIKIDGGRLFFDVVGAKLVPDGPAMKERPTVVALHGGPGGDHSYLKYELEPLADVAQLVFPDMRSTGRSDHTVPDQWNVERFADDVRALCDALEIEKPIVLGHSYGGYVAIAYGAILAPGKLVLYGAEARLHLSASLEVFKRLGGSRAHRAARAFGSPDESAAPGLCALACRCTRAKPEDPFKQVRMIANGELTLRLWYSELRDRSDPSPWRYPKSDADCCRRGRSCLSDRSRQRSGGAVACAPGPV